MILTIEPKPTRSHTHTIVFLHGRGSTPHRLAESLTHLAPDSTGRSLQEALPSVRWVFPSPPGAGPDCAIFQWFAPYHDQIQAKGLRDSVALLRKVISDEVALLGGRWDRIVLAGFSQGAVTAVHVLLHLERPLGALALFSGRMALPGRSLSETRQVLQQDDNDSTKSGDDESNEAVTKTPILLEHCADDHLLPIESGRVLRDALRGFGSDVTWHEYPDGGHWLSTPGGVDDAIRFLVHVAGIRELGR